MVLVGAGVVVVLVLMLLLLVVVLVLVLLLGWEGKERMLGGKLGSLLLLGLQL